MRRGMWRPCMSKWAGGRIQAEGLRQAYAQARPDPLPESKLHHVAVLFAFRHLIERLVPSS